MGGFRRELGLREGAALQGYACDSRLGGWVTQVGGAQVTGMQSWSVGGALVVRGGLVGEWSGCTGNRLLGSCDSKGPVLVRYVSVRGSHAGDEAW